MTSLLAHRSEHEIATGVLPWKCDECGNSFAGTLPQGFTALGMCEVCRSKLPECEGCGTPCAALNEVRFDQADGTEVARLCNVCTKGVGRS